MSYQNPLSTPHPPGGWFGDLWIVGAVAAWVVTPLLWYFLADTSGWGYDCSRSSSHMPPECPVEGYAPFAGMALLGMWILVTSALAFAFGVLEGRYEQFAHRRRTWAVLVAVAMPWAMLAYGVGNGLGRMLDYPGGHSTGTPTYR